MAEESIYKQEDDEEEELDEAVRTLRYHFQ